MIKVYSILVFFLGCISIHAQRIIIDPGHGWGAPSGNSCSNPDGRLDIEMETAFVVGTKLKNKLTASCSNISIYMTRTSNACNSWVSLSQRSTMANNWGGDVLLSIHTNGGGGTGTETYWCTNSPSNDALDAKLCDTVQKKMVDYGQWFSRRSVEDATFLGFHLYILRNTTTKSVLNEIGFGDNTSDYAKLASDSWRDQFTQAYYDALKSHMNLTCNGGGNTASCTVAVDLTCGDQYNGNTIDGTENIDGYSCAGLSEFGPEKIHRFTLTDSANVSIALSDMTTNLDVFLLSDSCNSNSCMDFGYFYIHRDSMPPGTYYIAVDGQGTAVTAQSGSYTLSIDCYPLGTPIASVEETVLENSIEIYPNPTDNFVQIKTALNANDKISYSLYSITGTKVSNGQFIQNKTLSLEDLAKGTYILHLQTNKESITRSIIKQ